MPEFNYFRHQYGVVISTELLFYLKSNSKNKDRPDFYVMKETIMPNAQAYNIRPNRLFYEELLAGMGRIRQLGLYHHWRKFNYDLDLQRVYNMSFNQKAEDEEDNENKKLTLEHLQVAFILLFLGCCLATLVFGLEVSLQKKH